MANYMYKVKSKFLKDRGEGVAKDIEKYFARYEDEEGEEEIYAIPYPYVFGKDSKLVRSLVDICNSEKWQKQAGLFSDDPNKVESAIAELAKCDLYFAEMTKDGKKVYKLIEDEETLKEFGTAMICVDGKDEETKGVLFIQSLADEGLCFYNSLFLNDAKEVIDSLLKEKVIYKALSPRDKRLRAERKKREEANCAEA